MERSPPKPRSDAIIPYPHPEVGPRGRGVDPLAGETEGGLLPVPITPWLGPCCAAVGAPEGMQVNQCVIRKRGNPLRTVAPELEIGRRSETAHPGDCGFHTDALLIVLDTAHADRPSLPHAGKL